MTKSPKKKTCNSQGTCLPARTFVHRLPRPRKNCRCGTPEAITLGISPKKHGEKNGHGIDGP